MYKIKLITIIMLLLSVYMVKAQNYNPLGFECVISGEPGQVNAVLPGGVFKPEAIEKYTFDPNAYFPVLIVYVQFHNDPGADVPWWPVTNDVPPTYMGSVIATGKNTTADWWNSYHENTATLSDYWMEVSRGKLHLVGQEVHVVLNEKSYYEQFGGTGRDIAMEDLFIALQNNPNINWLNYDKWSKDGSDFVYGDPDGFVDMLYIVARSNPCSEYWTGAMGGYFRPNGVRDVCTHGADHTVYNQGGVEIKVRRAFSETGSGFQVSPGHWGDYCNDWITKAPMEKWAMVSFTEHEHGHYLVGPETHYWEYHLPYSKINNYYGAEEFLSPYELFRFGYHEPQVVDFSSSYSIGDWTSRGTTLSQILKVPIGSSSRNEFFIIANRQKESFYDKIMWGDTAHDNPYRVINPEYGKGVYIYHAYPGEVNPEGYPWSIHIDQECADGLFNWVPDGYQYPDWSCQQNVEYYKRFEVSYNQDYSVGGFYNVDGKSLSTWFSLGKKAACGSYGDGFDRIWTNMMEGLPPIHANPLPYEIWTSRELMGDRWDAWKVGYNEVFSPYSSPSTKNWSNINSDIFIWLESMHGTPPSANFRIYKVGEGGLTEENILQLTPPAKPMNLKVEHCYQINPASYWYNKITWNHNSEPDMRRDMGLGMYAKRYKVYKTISANMTLLPDENNYTLLATVDIDENQTPTYIDLSEPSGCNGHPDAKCPPVCWVLHPVRYRVESIDIYETPSVKSDFASALAYNTSNGGGIEEGDTPPGFINIAPVEFALLQNYPNPFNPTTEIKYELPKSSFVTIKIYDAKGSEVAVLINNEYKEAGRYNAMFNGSNLASGIYFYTIEAGNFTATRKMVLIK